MSLGQIQSRNMTGFVNTEEKCREERRRDREDNVALLSSLQSDGLMVSYLYPPGNNQELFG